MTDTTPPRILALAPDGLSGLGVVVAAARAAALGILDLYPHFALESAQAFQQIRRLSDGPFAVRIGAGELLRSAGLGETDLLPGVVCIPVPSNDHSDFEMAVQAIRESGRLVLGEATSRIELSRAIAAGVGGLIVAGNEASGRAGAESTFVLMQTALAQGKTPVWVRGGIGPNVAAGCVAAGAAGVVLDGALLLARESPLSPQWRERIARWDGSETTVVAPRAGAGVRVFALPGSEALGTLRTAAAQGGAEWEAALSEHVGWRTGQCAPIGPEAALADRLARQFVTVGGIVQAVEHAIVNGLAAAQTARPLAESSPLAIAHGTRFPILQGPMTRVSDVPGFARAVAREGGLPFLALALLREKEVRALLRDSVGQLEGRPWGVGILGFVPPELRAEQLAVVKEFRPRFALFAGGRPDQAAQLEREGITTYLHVPSPGLLDRYLRDGSRRFVLEGRECGGHVGPRSSFVLWEQSVGVVGEALDRGLAADQVSLVFAGGIHDARSAAVVAALAGPLAARGVNVGILVGTGYLFTREAVATGAIVSRFQEEVIRCEETVLLETGPGHQVRVSRTPFVARFEQEKERLVAERQSPEVIREALESLNVGRLRVATKGVDRAQGADSSLRPVSDEYQESHGLFMLGEVATLRTATTTIEELHRELCAGSTELLASNRVEVDPAEGAHKPQPSDIAIVGMAALFPGAANVSQFWSNSLRGLDAITEVPADRWDWRLYYDADPKAPDKIISKWGGFVPDIAFDPIRYGMPPASLRSIEPAQLLALEVVRTAIADAGYAERPFPREKTAVVLGMGGGAAQLAMGYAFRSYLPMLDTVMADGGQQAIEACQGLLPDWTEDSFPGFLLNVTAGRIANRLNLGGANYAVDAACGSSLAAAALAVRELETGSADMVILGGVDTVQNPFTYLAFSKTQAFSPRGRCRPFDAGADGIVISEGVAALVLKRLADAERDGDRIYAVIKGVGASSDGRARGLTAPVVDGQRRALERAYAKAGISPSTVGYCEAHGTGTAVGDVVEIEALSHLFREKGAQKQQCTVGSVKSMIGHTKCAAGLAGLINASLSLYHHVVPPTIGIKTPNPKLDLREGPLKLCTESQPWLHPHAGRPRRAGVSAFGFGGTNFHAVLEEYDRNVVGHQETTVTEWPAELLVWQADTPKALAGRLDQFVGALGSASRPALSDLSHALLRSMGSSPGKTPEAPNATLAIVAATHDDLIEKLKVARAAIAEGRESLDDPRGIVFEANPARKGEPVAFLFPGQGAQAPGMLRELAVLFPEVRDTFEQFDRAFLARSGRALGPVIFPPPAFDEAAEDDSRRALMQTEVAQPAVGAACVAMLRLLQKLGCEPDMLAGHSYGELVALHAAGAMSEEVLAELSQARGRLMAEAGRSASGSMAAILAAPDEVERLIDQVPGVQVANWNGPRQTVVAGPSPLITRVLELAAAQGLTGRLLPVSSAFHTSLVASAREPLAVVADRLMTQTPAKPVYSNLDASPHPGDSHAIAMRLGDHLASPVNFAAMIDAMYRDGARVFLEVGPGSTLTPLIKAILSDRPHLAVSCQASGSSGLHGWLRSLARLVAAGVPLQLERLTRGRSRRVLDLERWIAGETTDPLSASTWLVNGSRARPWSEPEPARLGQARPISQVASEARKPVSRNGSHGVKNVPNGAPSSAKSTSRLPAMQRDEYPHEAGSPTPRSLTDRTSKIDFSTSMKTSSSAPSSTDRVIESFQQTMQAFLEVQKSTMLAYLAGRGGAAGVSTPSVVPAETEDRTVASASASLSMASPAASRNHNGKSRSRDRAGVPTDHQNGSVVAEAYEPRGAHTNGDGNGNGQVPAAPPSPSALTGPDRATITTRLLETVRDRTGYPIETLGLDMDMEADLGIDSIKRVEILGKMRDSFPQLKELSETSEAMDGLARARTLGMIVDRMAGLAEQLTGVSPAVEEPRPRHDVLRRDVEPVANVSRIAEKPVGGSTFAMANGHGQRAHGTYRRVLKVVEAPLPVERAGLMPGGRIVITDDGRGLARTLEDQLRAAGVPAERIGGPESPVDWTSPAAIGSALDRLRSNGPLAGVIHALPMGSVNSSQRIESEWSTRVSLEVRGLFLIAKAMASDLEKAARAGGACLIAATSLGGRLATEGSGNTDFFPGHGGVAGLVKTLAREWPAIRARVVDFSANDPIETIADRLITETTVRDGWAEVGYDQGRRIRLSTIESPLERVTSTLELKPNEPVLISGGARGITALAAAELGRIWHPALLIVGTTPLPVDGESADTRSLNTEAQIKAALHARLRHERMPASPAQIETAYQSLRRTREVRENLELLRETGATVAYAEADVRDPAALARVIDGWRSRHGEIAGLIHGAGLIKDKLIREKSVESFDRVLETKLDGALNLLQQVRGDALKFTAIFSSIAGRFGNVGQSDYAAANEILNKLAHWLDRRWPGRVVSLIWGPWAGVGMVSQLENHLGSLGLGMIAPQSGASLLLNELRHGRKGDVEVIYAGELGKLELPISLDSVLERAEAVP